MTNANKLNETKKKRRNQGRDREEMVFLLLSEINIVSRFRLNYFSCHVDETALLFNFWLSESPICLLSGQQRVLWLLSQWVFHITVLHAGSRPAPRQATFLRQPAAPPAVMASGWEVTNTWRWIHCKTNVLTLWSPSPDWHHASWSWMVSGIKTTCEMIFTAVSRNLSFARRKLLFFSGFDFCLGFSMWRFHVLCVYVAFF